MRHLSSCAVAMTVMFLLTGCERAKTKLDREVDRLCAVDGGIHVYETVKLPKENFGPGGEVFPQHRGLASNKGGLGPNYQSRFKNELLVTGNPAMQRIRNQIIRLTDQKVLGELIVYRRSGGDLPGPWEPSQHSCPAGPKFSLEQNIFQTEGPKE